MPGVFVELMKRVPSFQFLLHAYVRLLAVFMLFAGLNYWSAIIGVRLIDACRLRMWVCKCSPPLSFSRFLIW